MKGCENIKYLSAIITLKDAFTGTLNAISKNQGSFIKETKSVKGIIDKSYKLDKKELESALKDINDNISKNKEAFKKAQESMKNWKKLTEISTSSVKDLSKEVQDLSLKKQKLASDMEKIKASGNTEVFSKYENKLKLVDSALKEKTSSLSKARSENKKYTKELLDSQKEVSRLDVSLGALNKKLDDLSNKKSKISGFKDAFNMQNKSNNINKMYDDFDNNKKKYSGFDKLGGSLKNAGRSMTFGATLPVAAGFTASLSTGINFESAMSSVEATLGTKATTQGMEDLKQKAMEMGKETTKSAKESANAMEYMALAGWDTNQIMGGIEPILRMSEAGKADLATTSDLVTDSMSALSIEVEELPGFLDKVAKTSTSSNTSILEMMEAFIVAGGKSNSLGGDIVELSSLLGVMASRGLKGSDAGRGLSAILTNLTSPTGQAKKALEELNFTSFDANGNFIGLENTFYKLEDSLKGMTQEQRVNYLSMIAGKEHGKTLEAILGGLSKEYETLSNDIRNSKGALEEMSKTMTNNTSGSIAEFRSKLEYLGIKISESLLPAFSKILDFLGGMIDRFSNLSPQTQNTVIIFGLMALVIPPLITGIGALIGSVSTISSFISILKINLLGTAQSVGLLGKAFAFLSANPVVLIIGGVLLLVGALVTLYNTHEGFRNKVNEVWQGIVETIEWAVNGIIKGCNSIIGVINKIPGINIKTIEEVNWSDKSKNNKTKEAMNDTVNIGGTIAGSYKTGLSNVPYDGFVAELHKGERVLTAEENKHYAKKERIFKSVDNKSINNNVNGTSLNGTSSNNNNFSINVNVNYSGNNPGNENLNSMAEKVAKIISDKIKVMKLNVI